MGDFALMAVCVNKREVGVVGAVDQYMAVVKGSFRPKAARQNHGKHSRTVEASGARCPTYLGEIFPAVRVPTPADAAHSHAAAD